MTEDPHLRERLHSRTWRNVVIVIGQVELTLPAQFSLACLGVAGTLHSRRRWRKKVQHNNILAPTARRLCVASRLVCASHSTDFQLSRTSLTQMNNVLPKQI